MLVRIDFYRKKIGNINQRNFPEKDGNGIYCCYFRFQNSTITREYNESHYVDNILCSLPSVERVTSKESFVGSSPALLGGEPQRNSSDFFLSPVYVCL